MRTGGEGIREEVERRLCADDGPPEREEPRAKRCKRRLVRCRAHLLVQQPRRGPQSLDGGGERLAEGDTKVMLKSRPGQGARQRLKIGEPVRGELPMDELPRHLTPSHVGRRSGVEGDADRYHRANPGRTSTATEPMAVAPTPPAIAVPAGPAKRPSAAPRLCNTLGRW